MAADEVQPFVTELDLRRVKLSEATVSYLQEAMPKAELIDGQPVSNDDAEEGYDYEHWLDELFMPS